MIGINFNHFENGNNMPCPSRKKTQKTYFQRHNHHQKGIERRWKDKYYELERRFENFSENAGCFLFGFFNYDCFYLNFCSYFN